MIQGLWQCVRTWNFMLLLQTLLTQQFVISRCCHFPKKVLSVAELCQLCEHIILYAALNVFLLQMFFLFVFFLKDLYRVVLEKCQKFFLFQFRVCSRQKRMDFKYLPIGNGRILQHQDICETDGFLLQPLHIFSSFLELYDTVFHMPKERQTTSHLVLTPPNIVFINC